MSLSKDGKLLWERSMNEEFGMWTTHGGRMSTPIIDGNQLILSGLTFGWGQTAGPAHRFISFDKTNGQILWVSSPEGRPTDTIYANPFVADVDGTRLLISGGSDGAMLAMKIATGERVWTWLVSKRGLNTAALMVGPDVIVTHSEENADSPEMGMVAALDANLSGTLTDKDARWIVRDVQAGYASPVSDAERIYIVDNGGVLFAYNVKDGSLAWRKNLGTIQKSSPVLADGKLYVGTENGRFYMLKPGPAGVEVLDDDVDCRPGPMASRSTSSPRRPWRGGRVYLTTMDATLRDRAENDAGGARGRRAGPRAQARDLHGAGGDAAGDTHARCC